MIIITILVCLCAIALEIQLRRRDKDVMALVGAVKAVAYGKAKVVRKGDSVSIIYNQQRSH